MKTRNGFVSNSSSSSFALWTAELTREQKNVIYKLVENHNYSDGEGYIFIEKNLVYGTLDDHTGQDLYNYVKEVAKPEHWGNNC